MPKEKPTTPAGLGSGAVPTPASDAATSADMAVSSGTTDVAQKWAMLFERHPGIWILGGTGLFFATNGAITLAWGEKFSLNLAEPLSPAAATFLSIFATAILLIGMYAVIKRAGWVQEMRTLGILLGVCWLAGLAFATTDYIARNKTESPDVYFTHVDYLHEDARFEVHIPRKVFGNFQGNRMILAVRNVDKVPWDQADGFDFIDEPMPTVVNEKDYERTISCPKTSVLTKYGEKVQCLFIVVPSTFKPPKKASLDDFLQGDEGRIMNKATVVASIHKINSLSVQNLFEQIEDPVRADLLQKLTQKQADTQTK